jgi:hypothetical protein
LPNFPENLKGEGRATLALFVSSRIDTHFVAAYEDESGLKDHEVLLDHELASKERKRHCRVAGLVGE